MTPPVNPHPIIIATRDDDRRSLTLKISPAIVPAELHALFIEAATADTAVELETMLKRALFYVCAFDGVRLVGFAKVIDDGGVHGFLLDPTVSPPLQRQGIGTALVGACAAEAKKRGIEWLHVDFEPRLESFYRRCGFAQSRAGVMNLGTQASTGTETSSR